MVKYLSFLHLVTIIFVSLSRSFAQVPPSQIIVLHNLYTSSNGDHWIWKPSSQPRWNFSTSTVNPCSTDSQTWQGITCDKSPSSCQQAQDICHIIDLSLVEFNLTGALPSLSNLTRLQTLLLDSNYLQGPLPLSPFPLLLTRLSLYHNQFTSTLPSDISNCLRLRSIELSVNQFTGAIPSGIGLFLQLRTLYLDDNSLTGPIPSTFQFLSQINYLILSGNSLTGEIPSFMGSLTTLQVFILSDNSNMAGTIPPELGSLTRLQILMLMNTGRSGPIIPELWSLTKLMILELCENSLTGTLPPAISSLSNLQLLLLNTCLLDGPIPSTLSQITSLYLLDLEGNYFTSSIPLNMFPMMQQSLHHLTLSSNLFTSSLPLDITSLSLLETLTLEDNYFTGTLPNEISQLSSLNLFSLQHNLFTSSFPIGIGALTQLTVLTLQDNAFTFALPASLSNLTELLVFDLSSNLFTSSFPVFLSSMSRLQELYLQDNLFTSSISPFLVNASHLPLLSLDMSDNYFSNTIPAELFLISSLEILSLTRNCFHGTLPSTICAASSLVILSMDGLGAASSCPGSISIPWTTVVLNSVLDGSIPSCIWTDLKENLILLSLSGNGLTGNIESIPTDSNLINISLSHNHLTGTIPKALFHPPSSVSRLQAVDLSYNKFIGSIPSTFQSYPFRIRLVNFQVNRLSGDAPPSPLFLSDSTTSPSSGKPTSSLGILETSLIKILEGNLFSCARLPSYDPDSAVYTCGAQAFNQSLYTLSAVGGFLILGILLCLFARYNQEVWGSREVRITEHRDKDVMGIAKNTPRLLLMDSIQLLSSLYQHTRDYYFYIYPSPPSPLSASDPLSSSAPTSSPLLLSFCSNNDLFKSMESLSATLFVIGLISSLPFYLLKSDSTNPSNGHTHSTHVDVYEWIYTATYTTGILPALVLMASWALTITAYLFFFHLQSLLQRRQTEEEAEQLTHTSATLLPILPPAGKRPITLQSLDIERGYAVSPISIPLLFSTALLPLLHFLSGSFRVLVNIAVVGTVNAVYILSLRRDLSPTQHLLCEISIAIFSIFWKGLCLPLLFSTSESSSSYSEYKTFSSTLNSLFIPCLTTALTSTSCYQGLFVESSPITVSYPQQYCTEYVFSLVSQTSTCYTYSTRVVTVRPFIPSFAYNYSCGSTILTAYIPVYLYVYTAHILFNVLVPYLILLLPAPSPIQDDHFSSSLSHPRRFLRRVIPGIYWPEKWIQQGTLADRNDKSAIRRLYPVEAIGDSLIQHAIIFFSFGLCSPFLTLAIALTIWLIVVRWKILLTRGLLKLESIRSDDPDLSPAVDSLVSSLRSLTSSLLPSLRSKLWIPTLSSCVFFAFVCWDISGDAVGWERSIWVPCVVISLAIFLWVIAQRAARVLAGSLRRRSGSPPLLIPPLREERQEGKGGEGVTVTCDAQEDICATHSVLHQLL